MPWDRYTISGTTHHKRGPAHADNGHNPDQKHHHLNLTGLPVERENGPQHHKVKYHYHRQGAKSQNTVEVGEKLHPETGPVIVEKTPGPREVVDIVAHPDQGEAGHEEGSRQKDREQELHPRRAHVRAVEVRLV